MQKPGTDLSPGFLCLYQLQIFQSVSDSIMEHILCNMISQSFYFLRTISPSFIQCGLVRRDHSGHVVDNCTITLLHTYFLRSHGITQPRYYVIALSRSYAITQFGCCQYSAGFDKSASCGNRRRMPLRTVGLTLRRLYPRIVLDPGQDDEPLLFRDFEKLFGRRFGPFDTEAHSASIAIYMTSIIE